jgi:hypothetical protein
LEQELENPPAIGPDLPPETTDQRWLEDTSRDIVRATRSWIQFGTLGFAALCIVIGAVEALFGK